jgi:hypothetical protein
MDWCAVYRSPFITAGMLEKEKHAVSPSEPHSSLVEACKSVQFFGSYYIGISQSTV